MGCVRGLGLVGSLLGAYASEKFLRTQVIMGSRLFTIVDWAAGEREPVRSVNLWERLPNTPESAGHSNGNVLLWMVVVSRSPKAIQMSVRLVDEL